ncbi:hypothetical protein BN6_57220 [Saccharothrix espanaensis DSM 44229]|uniref:Uncharacterized protein n=1 Tax=Saccharothrix espanaensis (strain ATCC 51144 / DSM 44229 / JCM 9112 / NBRC 15066 / NRRL 15764) TaxID=1179773 RepID=K0JYG2_SACES|nr:hypothetical protein BN6_57220 [Saccharothrix espanaensis DSM 44229]
MRPELAAAKQVLPPHTSTHRVGRLAIWPVDLAREAIRGTLEARMPAIAATLGTVSRLAMVNLSGAGGHRLNLTLSCAVVTQLPVSRNPRRSRRFRRLPLPKQTHIYGEYCTPHSTSQAVKTLEFDLCLPER